MSKIVLATGNQGKVKELAYLLKDQDFTIVPQSEFKVSEVAETGTTFIENAIIKARHAAQITGLPAIADDSGLAVDFLNGAPGVYSARYAADKVIGREVNDDDNIDKLLNALVNVPDEQRSARFHCVLVYMKHQDDPTPIICHGIWQGSIARARAGKEGFGYDPIFWQNDLNMMSAQLPRDLKNKLSHRGQALAQLVTQMNAS